MTKRIALFSALVLLFMTSGVAFAAPVSNLFRNTIPEATDTYDNGTSTAEWKNVYTQNITISGTCTGCGSGSTFPFTPQSYGNSTSTTLGLLNGFFSSASSTISGAFHLGLSSGGLAINGSGLVYSGATTTAGTGLSYSGNAFNVTGLTTTQFSSANVSQWTNDANYLVNTRNINTTYPLQGGGNLSADRTLTLAFGTTTSNTWAGTQTFTNAPILAALAGLIAGNAGQTYATATSTGSCSGFITCNPFFVVGSGAPTITVTGQLSVTNGGTNASSLGSHMLLAFNGTSVVASSTPTAAAYLATSTAATSTFAGGVSVGGELKATDKDTTLTGDLSPLHRLTLQTGTTTSWIATTSGAYIPQVVAPFAGTIQNAKCSTDASFLAIDLTIASTHLAYFVASTTVGTITFSANNTFTAGQVIKMTVGTTTSSGALLATCTIGVTETP